MIWATGYRSDYSWIDLPILDDDSLPRHRRGVTEVPGLYFLGLSWQHTRGSALLGWVCDDAEFIVGELEAAAAVDTDHGYERAPTPSAAEALEGANR